MLPKKSEGEAGSGADIYIPTDSDLEDFDNYKSGECMFWNYSRLGSWNVIQDIVNSKLNCYFLVFKPLNSNYNPNYDGLDFCRKKIGNNYSYLIMTREIKASKIHYNALVVTDITLDHLHERLTSKYMIWCEEVTNDHMNIARVHQYIIKESQERLFYAKKPPLDIYVAERLKRAIKRHYNKRAPK